MSTNTLRNDTRANVLKALYEAESLDIENGEILFEPLGIAIFPEFDDETA